MKIEYRWKKDSPDFGVSAQEAGEALDEIREKNRGRLHPGLILRTLKLEKKRSPLYGAFDWGAPDDALDRQARQLIRSLEMYVVETA